MADWFVGIDYGTTKSAIAIYLDGGEGGPKTFPIEPGTGTPAHLPSVVRLKRSNESGDKVELYTIDGNSGIGHHALFSNTIEQTDTHTFRHAKLDIGRLEFSNDRIPPVRFKNVLPKDIAALILNHLKTDVEKKRGVQLHSTTISVPANWNPIQRQATKHAALLAGFKDVALVEEPVAALIYLDKGEGFRAVPNQKVMVVDFGGGTCDIAIVRMLAQRRTSRFFKTTITPQVQRVVGNNALGGQLINKILLSKYPEADLSTPARRSKLLRDIEYLKTNLNTRNMWPLAWGFCQKQSQTGDSESPKLLDNYPEDMRESLPDEKWFVTAQNFHQWLRDDIQTELANFSYPDGRSVIQAFRDLVSDAVVFSKGAPIDRVYLVGGSSLLYFVMPIVLEILPELKEGASLIRPTDPTECVALGAAWHEHDRHKQRELFTPRFFYNLSIKAKHNENLPPNSTNLSTKNLSALLANITNSFNGEEIDQLCFKMGIHEDEFSDKRSDKARELIGYVVRHDRLLELLKLCQDERPSGEWNIDSLPEVNNAPTKTWSTFTGLDNSNRIWILRVSEEGKIIGKKGFEHVGTPFKVSQPITSFSLGVHSVTYQNLPDENEFVKTLREVNGKVIDTKQDFWPVVNVDRDGIINLKITNASRNIRMVENDFFPIDMSSQAFSDIKNSTIDRFTDLG